MSDDATASSASVAELRTDYNPITGSKYAGVRGVAPVVTWRLVDERRGTTTRVPCPASARYRQAQRSALRSLVKLATALPDYRSRAHERHAQRSRHACSISTFHS